MSNGNIWGQTQLPNFMDQVMQAATWDAKMRMQKEAQIMNILQQANPVKFMSYKNQEEQVTRYNEMHQVITDLTKDRSGRYTTQDMMDINFMVTEFETWQNGQMGKLDMFKQEYNAGIGSLNDIKLDTFLAGVDLYREDPDSWMPGKMVKAKPYDPYTRYMGYKIKGRTRAIDEIPKVYEKNGMLIDETISVWAKQEEKESIVLREYSTDPRVREGIDEAWDRDLELSEQKLWVERLEKYNSEPGNPRIDNVKAFFGMKFFGGMIMPNTRQRDAQAYKPKDTNKRNVPTLVEMETPQEITGEYSFTDKDGGGHIVSTNYGTHKMFRVDNFKTGKDLIFDSKTFIVDNKENVAWMGKPATKATREDGSNLGGRAEKIQEMFVAHDVPLYIGDGETFDKAFETTEREGLAKKIRGPKKRTFEVNKWEPLSEDHLAAIKGSFETEQEFNDWYQNNVGHRSIALMPLSGAGDLTVLRVFDELLAGLMGIDNAEFILKHTLPGEEEEEEEEEKSDGSLKDKWATEKRK